MNEMQIFNYNSNQVRTVQKNEEPWFVLKDVCEVFGETNYRRVSGRLENDEKGVSQIATPGGSQNMTVINEAGLYSALFMMQPEKARGVSDEYIAERQTQLKAFRRWVTHEVLPAIRKTGGYVADEDAFIGTYLPYADDATREMFRSTLATVRSLNAKIEADRPKVLFADSVATAKSSILIGELAKLIKQNGVDMGQNRLFRWMRDNKYLIKRNGADFNTPTQRAMEMKLFEIKETAITHSDGHVSINKTVKVTGRGQQYFINLFLGEAEQ